MLTILAPPDAAVIPLVGVLEQFAEVLAGLPAADYLRKPVGVVPSSVGGHVRHCLDHVEALLGALDRGRIDYDHRARGTAIEADRDAALGLLRCQITRLLAARLDLGRSLRLSALLSPDAPPVEVTTTLGRELAFVLSHTIHHGALLAVMVKLLGGAVPPRFGYAPATLAYEGGGACAH